MTLVNTASQPYVMLCLMVGGIIYYAFSYFILSFKVNPFINNLITGALTVTGSLVYFAILFVTNHGEMRVYTLVSYLVGVYIGYYFLNKIFKNSHH